MTRQGDGWNDRKLTVLLDLEGYGDTLAQNGKNKTAIKCFYG